MQMLSQEVPPNAQTVNTEHAQSFIVRRSLIAKNVCCVAPLYPLKLRTMADITRIPN